MARRFNPAGGPPDGNHVIGSHHRGQVCHWARDLGAPIDIEDQPKLYDWAQLWKEVAGPAG